MKRLFELSLWILLVAVSRNGNALSFQPIHFPGSNSTQPMSIDGNKIVGQYCDDSVCAAFVFDGSTYSKFDLPDVDVFGLSGIDGENVVGLLYDPIQREQRTFFGTTVRPSLWLGQQSPMHLQSMTVWLSVCKIWLWTAN